MKHRYIITPLIGLLFISGCSNHFRQSSHSMEPTIHYGDSVSVDTVAYRAATPQRWDIITFMHPEKQSPWSARIVGLPGEIISIENGEISINGNIQSKPDSIKTISYVPSIAGSNITFPFVIPSNSYFVLGDNSQAALDSRFFGSLPSTNITGKVLIK